MNDGWKNWNEFGTSAENWKADAINIWPSYQMIGPISQIPKFYELPKLNKPNKPMQQID